MINAYKYFFYRLYSFTIGNGEENPGVSFSIAFGFLGMNLLTIFFGLQGILGYKFPVEGKPLQFLVLGAYIYFNYYLLIKDGKYKAILNSFNEEPPIKESKGTLIVAAYMIVSISAFLITIINVKRILG